MAQDSKDIKETIGALDDYVLLGRSGLRVSPLCLGAMGLGSNFEESKNVFDYYYEKGGNFIDTANVYNFGESEQFLKEYIADKRSQVVIATKYTLNPTAMMPNVKFNPNAGGNNRKSLVENLNESLKRLGTGYTDILYVHAWEYNTPIEEVMRSLDDVVRSGKAFYVAASDTPTWVISCTNMLADLRGWRFLTGKYTRESIANTKKGSNMSDYRNNSAIVFAEDEQNWKILDEVIAIAAEIKRSPAQVTLNWISQKPGITSPIVGARTKAQLVENLKALEFKLTPEQMARLDAVSAPKHIPFPYSYVSTLRNIVNKGMGLQYKGIH
ncbi:NADP-dependent oxidoreductase domain-containing protein [Gigaspora rosea]|uniref:NADP-dependent oxidoreductase domain-containing protein n=1 Tax=Gigaspora rosea TaxID=44941 RepID=A0A397W823_9GLOM|nr:NADP-dependent oxidoreductase domain-containing protein [Gigaspora rosea]